MGFIILVHPRPRVNLDINFGDYSTHPEFVEVLNQLGISYEQYKETIARIIFASSKLPVTLYFNYDDGRLMRMFKQDEPEYVKSVIDIHYLRDMEGIVF